MFIGNKKCRIYAACGVSQTPKYKKQIERDEEIAKELQDGNKPVRGTEDQDP